MMKLLLFAIVGVAYVSAQYDTYDYPMKDVESLGGNFSFNCSEGDIPENSTVAFWILPDISNVNSSNPQDGVAVSHDNELLSVLDVQQEDLGIYFCVVITSEGEYYMQRFGLNVKGPYFEDLGEKYEQNIIYAFSAMGAFLVSAVYVWVVYKFSYEKREKSSIKPELGSNSFELEANRYETVQTKVVQSKPNSVTNGDVTAQERSENGSPGGQANPTFQEEDEMNARL